MNKQLEEVFEVKMHACVTDAGQYVERMEIDFGEERTEGLTTDTFEVFMRSFTDYGEDKGKPYAYYDASRPLRTVKAEMKGNRAVVYFDLSQAPTVTWLKEGRNYPAVLSFEIRQKKELKRISADGRERRFTGTYTCGASSYRDLADDEISQFQSCIDRVNYQFHKGDNSRLIVFFHGNGEGDLPVKATDNNIIQLLGNRGGTAWVSEEAKEVFGNASVMCFQAPSMWYFALKDHLTEICHEEIMKVVRENQIKEDEIYLAGFSAGGFMSVRMLIAYPELFRSAMITCPALDAANARSGSSDAVPADEELAALKDSPTGIWLVQGETDSAVDTEKCAKRIWRFLSANEDVTETRFAGDRGIASPFTTYETGSGKYKMTLYETVDRKEVTGISGEKRQGGMLKFAEDYDRDGVYTEVKYNDHWSWIYTLRNNPVSADGTHIWQWAVHFGR